MAYLFSFNLLHLDFKSGTAKNLVKLIFWFRFRW